MAGARGEGKVVESSAAITVGLSLHFPPAETEKEREGPSIMKPPFCCGIGLCVPLSLIPVKRGRPCRCTHAYSGGILQYGREGETGKLGRRRRREKECRQS